jgi:hypothetical protein
MSGAKASQRISKNAKQNPKEMVTKGVIKTSKNL